MNNKVIICLLFLSLLISSFSHSEVSILYSGVMKDPSETIVSDGSYTFNISVYNGTSEEIFSEIIDVQIEDGVFWFELNGLPLELMLNPYIQIIYDDKPYSIYHMWEIQDCVDLFLEYGRWCNTRFWFLPNPPWSSLRYRFLNYMESGDGSKIWIYPDRIWSTE